MNDQFDLHIITHDHSEIYCGYFRCLVFGNSLTFFYISFCFYVKPPNFPRLIGPRALDLLVILSIEIIRINCSVN